MHTTSGSTTNGCEVLVLGVSRDPQSRYCANAPAGLEHGRRRPPPIELCRGRHRQVYIPITDPSISIASSLSQQVTSRGSKISAVLTPLAIAVVRPGFKASTCAPFRCYISDLFQSISDVCTALLTAASLYVRIVARLCWGTYRR